MPGLKYNILQPSLQELIRRQKDGCLNLNPGFQRNSVWRPSDRSKLIKSILDGDPIPTIFLYKNFERGRWVYHVLDGKQRLESVLMFLSVRPFHRRHDRLEVKYQFAKDEHPYKKLWEHVPRKQRSEFLGYKVPVVEVEVEEGGLGPITELFVRLNSLGKPLTGQEKRHAFVKNIPFLHCAQSLAEKHGVVLKRMGVITDADRARMQDVELCSEVLLALQLGGPQHKKKVLDKAMKRPADDKGYFAESAKRFGTALGHMQRLFPGFNEALRYHQRADWYSLMLVLDGLVHDEGAVFTKSACAQAGAVLKRFALKVDDFASRHKEVAVTASGNKEARAYFVSVQAGTDALSNRMKRAKILKGLLAGIFELRDVRRRFSPEQRRLIFNSSRKPVCLVCRKPLNWTNFHADHVLPYSRGGKTVLKNAQPLCARHNLIKGARRR